MTRNRRKLGRWGETKAAEYLKSLGYTIIDRNVYTPYGELDLIAKKRLANQERTIFIEVKTRTTTTFGYPEESITHIKEVHILASAQTYLQEHPKLGDSWQVDVIAIYCQGRQNNPEIRHFKNVFS